MRVTERKQEVGTLLLTGSFVHELSDKSTSVGLESIYHANGDEVEKEDQHWVEDQLRHLLPAKSNGSNCNFPFSIPFPSGSSVVFTTYGLPYHLQVPYFFV